MSDDPVLKECPFCGCTNTKFKLANPPFMLKKWRGRYIFAGCPECGVTTPLIYANNKTGSPLLNAHGEKLAKAKAAKIWNRRTDDV